jgi:myo-inositol-1(or 4)-monophosphatase
VRAEAGRETGQDTEDGPDRSAESLRRVAEKVAAEAAAHLRGLPRPDAADPASVSTKSSPTDVVTANDTAVETLLRTRLAQLRPGEPVVGEEAGGTGGDAVTWVVDPIDGTVNYLHGLPWYGVSVAAAVRGVVVAGAVAEPASGRLWSAAADAGATCDGRPLRVSGLTDLARAVVGTGFAYSATRRAAQARMVAGMLPSIGDVRRAGSAALDLCAVAAGWLDGYVEHGTNWWDWAAASLIAAEAGAVVRVPGPPGAGAPDDDLGPDVVLAATPGIAAAFAELARTLGAAEI